MWKSIWGEILGGYQASTTRSFERLNAIPVGHIGMVQLYSSKPQKIVWKSRRGEADIQLIGETCCKTHLKPYQYSVRLGFPKAAASIQVLNQYSSHAAIPTTLLTTSLIQMILQVSSVLVVLATVIASGAAFRLHTPPIAKMVVEASLSLVISSPVVAFAARFLLDTPSKAYVCSESVQGSHNLWDNRCTWCAVLVWHGVQYSCAIPNIGLVLKSLSHGMRGFRSMHVPPRKWSRKIWTL